jgi:hypothetical protein
MAGVEVLTGPDLVLVAVEVIVAATLAHRSHHAIRATTPTSAATCNTHPTTLTTRPDTRRTGVGCISERVQHSWQHPDQSSVCLPQDQQRLGCGIMRPPF